MPIFPGAPWLPKFKGTADDIKYIEWKEQIQGILGAQELEEATSVAIIIGALAGEAKRQVNVLEAAEKNTVAKVFTYLDSLYSERTPHAVLRSQFFSCVQRPSESMPSFLLRLRELHSRLRQHDPDGPPSAANLRDQMLMGLRESPLSQALKVYARRNPDQDFTALRQEALLLEGEYGRPQAEVTCSAVDNSYVRPRVPTPQEADWKEAMKREIMEDVKSQMKGLAQDLMKEIRPLLQSPTPPPLHSPRDRPPPVQTRRDSPQPSYSNDWDEQGRPICRHCRRAGHMARNCRSRPQLN